MGRKTVINEIVTPAKLAKINPENIQLMNDFLVYLRSTQHSEETLKVYKSDLLIVFVFMLEHCNNKPFVTIRKRDIVKLQTWMMEEHQNSSARVRRVKATLSSFSNYIANVLDDEYPMFKNIIKCVENPPLQPVREKSVFTDEELHNLLSTLVVMQDYEKACMVALAMYSGRRKAELALFKVSYFDDENIVFGSLYRTPEKIKTKGRGKGKFIHCYTLAKSFDPYLTLWLEERNRRGIESEWLFPNPCDPTKPIGINQMDKWTSKFTEICGKPFYFHAMRHYFTTHLIREGLPESVITSVVGWDSVDMVRVYNDMPVEEELGRYFNEEGIAVNKRPAIESL